MKESTLTQAQQSFNVLLIGDAGSDVYFYGSVERLSQEAPIPIFDPLETNTVPGMASNVMENLLGLGCNVTFAYTDTCIKERYIEIKTNKQLFRIDREDTCSPYIDSFDAIDQFDAIVISDYDKGTVTYELIDNIRSTYSGPIFLDTKKKDLSSFYGIYVKINEYEYNKLSEINDRVIVTLGSRGAMFRGKDYPTTPVGVADVTGAGDTFLSALCFEYLRNNNIEKAIDFANRAASIVVQRQGTYALTKQDVLEKLL
jgi:bifunctional ADP-heptose synthase (sugar kinase/adenylyltransferase)